MQQHLNIFVQKFTNYLEFEKGYSKQTVKSYLQDLKILFAFENDIKSINNDKIQTLVLKQKSLGKSAKSIKRLISSIRSYLQFLHNIKIIKKEIYIDIQTPKTDKLLPKTLSYEHVLLLIKNCDNKHKKRNSAIISTLYGCGIRVSELVALNKNDIDFKEKFVKVFGKGSKHRFVPIGDNALKLLQDYLQETGSEEAVFLNKNNSRISVRSVQDIISKSGELAGIEFAITPHMLRHSAASHLLQSSGDLRSTQEFLGHKNITSTQVYTHLDYQHLTQTYDEKHPHGNENKKK